MPRPGRPVRDGKREDGRAEHHKLDPSLIDAGLKVSRVDSYVGAPRDGSNERRGDTGDNPRHDRGLEAEPQ